jgi:hypothetical protein
MTDDELIAKIARRQANAIMEQRLWRNNPLWQPARTPEQRAQDNAEWADCIERGLGAQVHGQTHLLIERMEAAGVQYVEAL